jgi:hypothetical protein
MQAWLESTHDSNLLIDYMRSDPLSISRKLGIIVQTTLVQTFVRSTNQTKLEEHKQTLYEMGVCVQTIVYSLESNISMIWV